MRLNNKIKPLEEIVDIVGARRAEGGAVVHCHGVFDLLHIGHIKHLEAARKLGEMLVVTVTPDRFVNKGPHRPAFPEFLRAEALAALNCVDYVAINKWPSAVETIKALKPSKYVKGVVHSNGKRDHSIAIEQEEEAIKSVDGEMVLTDEETYSATTLINRYMDIFSPEAVEFLKNFREKYTPEKIIGYLHDIRSLKILTIGETIIDEYVFCSQIGKASKEAVLAVNYNYKETYAGGILAVANHLSNFCDKVGLLSSMGERDSYWDFIKNSLYENIASDFIHKRQAPTIVKRRFMEEYLATKLLEVYVMKNNAPDKAEEDSFCAKLEEALPKYDVVVVADYGHGLITDRAVSILCEKARFLAVNTQTNAGNMGFNMISKYPRADFVSIAEPEVRLDNRDMSSDIMELALKSAERVSCDKFIVTRGKNGCIAYDRSHGFTNIPAFSVKMVDRIGAGDALLSLTAPCAALGAPMDIIGFIGNVAGAEACAIMGNKTSIEPSSLYRHVTSLMS